jgi:polar amino acid transport system substrate-binding protein
MMKLKATNTAFTVLTKKIMLWSLLLLSLSFFLAPAQANEKLSILTDSWPPYINAEGDTTGSAARLIEILYDFDDIQTNWHYMPYELSYLKVKNQKAVLSFPYFKTPQRSKEVLFSQAIFSVTSKVYFNRQFLTSDAAQQAYAGNKRIGRVSGYSYGESIDKELTEATVFATERLALTALFNNVIDVLPMTEGVMMQQLNDHFSHRKQLIVPLDGIMEKSSLHVIAAKNSEGKEAIEKLNKVLSYLMLEGVSSLPNASVVEPDPVDVAKLITTEGYPLIIGQTAEFGSDIDFYTLPQGTQVLVLEWSSKIVNPSGTDRIYKTMMDLSKVVLLNGPHVGKELFVRNMHLELM